MNCSQRYDDEELDMYYRMQLTSKEIEYLLRYRYVVAKIINCEIPTWEYMNRMIITMLLKDVLISTVTKTMKKVLTTHHEINFNSELNEVLGFIEKKDPAGTHLSEKPTNITRIDKIYLMCT